MGVRVSRPSCRDPRVLLDTDAELDLNLVIVVDLDPLHQPLPFPGFINGMHQRQFVFAVQRFRDLRRQRSKRTVAIGGEVGAVGGIDADHMGYSPPEG